jgi:type I restriction enzyme R subunit
MLVDGVEVEYLSNDGRIVGDRVRLVDFDNPDNNDWLVVNQFTVVKGQANRRPDIIVFLNGMPVAVIELKNAADENTSIWTAYSQLQTYKNEIPSLFAYNEALIISDGVEARIGSLTAGDEWFHVWRTIDGSELAPDTAFQLQVLIAGFFEKRRFMDFLRYFIVFEDDGEKIIKKIAGYHQYHAVNRAVESTVKASGPEGDRKCGVVWHTQGSGKSLTMVFYAGRIILHPAMENPTIVVITDRNDLDDQLFGTFSRCQEILRQKPIQAESTEHLKELLQVASGGVIFTTIQKFFPDRDNKREENGGQKEKFPLLSDRSNIVVIADEAHRSQYGFQAKLDKKEGSIDYGFAQHLRDALPNASFIGFTGTPVELADRNTRAVFGEYISVYDIKQAIEDHATVPIYYESRLAELDLDESERPKIDPEFEEVTEGEEEYRKEKLKIKWAQLEAVVGAEKRLTLVAKDIVEHFERRLEAMDGKAMVVCMSRRICVALYNAIVKLRPEWHNNDDTKGAIKVVMTGSAKDTDWQQHIRSKKGRDDIANRFKDSKDPLKIVIVRDMWLTGFDVPCLHTMYLDKPMKGHTLMQAIARVNRVFKDKPGGLIVDYLGIYNQLREALAAYTDNGGRGEAVLNQEKAVAKMLEKYEICKDLFYGFDYSGLLTGTPAERLAVIQAANNFILGKRDDDQKNFIKHAGELSSAFALSLPQREALRIREEVAFFQAVRAAIVKLTKGDNKTDIQLDQAVRQIVEKAVVSDQVIDIFSATGLKKPDISILSEEFLEEVRNLPHKNLAVELLNRLLRDEIKTMSKRNLVQSHSFAEMLEKTIRAYKNRTISAAKVIAELIDVARHIRNASQRGEKLNLTEEELAFYDALEINDSAVKIMGDEVLKKIAKELVETVRQNVSIDWTMKESVRANIRRLVKRILRKYGYPPDKQDKATLTVLEQAELLCPVWV